MAGHPGRLVVGELAVEAGGKEAIPAYGELTVGAPGGPLTSPIGRDGRFYLENLPPGRHPAEIEWSGGRCRLFIEAPEAAERADLGRVRCRAE